MNKRGCLNYRDFAFALTLSKQNIILLPGSLPGASKDYEKKTKVRAIISYADSDYHNGTIYRACNFRYCGLSDRKKDFYFADGTKHSRGSIKGEEGEWRDRTQKHRYVMMFDKSLDLLWTDESSVLSADQ